MEIAKREGVELKFTIVDEFDGAKLIKNEEFDLVLLNPLLRFLLNNTDENIFTLSGKSPIKMLDSKIYGSLNAEALYKLIVS
jgi:cellobiose-specific phosphotransferase system component IIB